MTTRSATNPPVLRLDARCILGVLVATSLIAALSESAAVGVQPDSSPGTTLGEAEPSSGGANISQEPGAIPDRTPTIVNTDSTPASASALSPDRVTTGGAQSAAQDEDGTKASVSGGDEVSGSATIGLLNEVHQASWTTPTVTPCLQTEAVDNASASAGCPENGTLSESSGTPPASSDPSDSEQPSNPSNRRRPSRHFPAGMVSEETVTRVYDVVTYSSLALSAVGMVFNVFVVAVYVQPAMRSPCSSYLVALGLAELLFLLLMAVGPVTNDVIKRTTGRSYAYAAMIAIVPTFLNAFPRRIAFTMTLVVSVERFIAVTFPLKASQWRLSRNPYVISASVYLLVLALHLPVPFKYEVIAVGKGAFTLSMRAWWRANIQALGVFEVAIRVLFVYIPLFGTLFLNVLTILALQRHRQRSRLIQSTRDVDSTKKADTQRTVSILVSTLVFVILSMPTHVLSIFNTYHPDVGFRKKEHNLYMMLTQIFILLEILSNIVDFFAYISLCKRFSVTFQELFCRLCKKAASDETSMNTISTQMSITR